MKVKELTTKYLSFNKVEVRSPSHRQNHWTLLQEVSFCMGFLRQTIVPIATENLPKRTQGTLHFKILIQP